MANKRFKPTVHSLALVHGGLTWSLEGKETMDMIPVSSSAISAIGYDPATMQMSIRFKEGHAYTFCRVPESVFTAFLRASSKGTYYTDHIRDRYQC